MIKSSRLFKIYSKLFWELARIGVVDRGWRGYSPPPTLEKCAEIVSKSGKIFINNGFFIGQPLQILSPVRLCSTTNKMKNWSSDVIEKSYLLCFFYFNMPFIMRFRPFSGCYRRLIFWIFRIYYLPQDYNLEIYQKITKNTSIL